MNALNLFAIAVAALLSGAAAQDHWPSFRGPDSTGVVEDPSVPESWSTTENVRWKSEVPGRGWSSPVVWGDRIFLTSVVSEADEAPRTGLYSGGPQGIPSGEHRWKVYALDWETGEIVWEREVHRAHPSFARHLKNSYASETPIVDGERLYAYFGNVGVFVFSHEGEPVWRRSFEPVETRNGWGTAGSPVMHGDRLFIVNDNEEASWLAALDAASGEEKWRIRRDEESNWSTPFVWKNAVRTELVTTGARKVRSYGLDGDILWELGPMSSITIPTPFAAEELLYVASGYVGDEVRPVYAVKPGASGDISLRAGETRNEHVAWSWPQAGPYNPSPIVYRGRFYTLHDRGFFTAHDARTGAEIYDKRRIDPAAGAFTASPWAANGKIFCLSEEGVTYVIEAGDRFAVSGKNALDEVTLATPAIVRGSLFIRTASHLYRITSEGLD